jgi:hypothetical protein
MNNPYADFGRLYDAVTAELRLFIAEAAQRGEVTPAEIEWFEDIIVGFTAEFDAWPVTPQPHIRGYLDLFDTTPSRILRIAGHAFLHVAYDLPRVLANHMNHPQINRNQIRNLFLRPAPRFRQVFRQHLRKGGFGFILRPVGSVGPVEVLAYWLIALRSVAWIHAEILADSQADRIRLEQELAAALHAAGDDARSKPWIFGVPRLEISRLFQFAPAPISFNRFAMIFMVIFSVLFGMIWFREQSVSTKIQTLGQHILLETTKALSKARGTRHAMA